MESKKMKSNKLWSVIYMLILIMGVSFFLASCDDDDDDDGNNIENVIPGSDNDDNSDNGDDDENNGGSGSGKTECRYCLGSGECSNSNCDGGMCIRCGGTGYTYSGKYKFSCSYCSRGKCNACHGSGKCSQCGGRGYI